jgi:hypothetical protein
MVNVPVWVDFQVGTWSGGPDGSECQDPRRPEDDSDAGKQMRFRRWASKCRDDFLQPVSYGAASARIGCIDASVSARSVIG